jgi:pimeloyl-ACP methyl ester carboxylesterase
MINSVRRLSCLVALVFVVCADCRAQDGQQPPPLPVVSSVRVIAGNEIFDLPEQRIAYHYAPYALLAAQAYYSAVDPFSAADSNSISLAALRSEYFDETRRIVGPRTWLRLNAGWTPLQDDKNNPVEGTGIVACTDKHRCVRGIPIGGLSWQVWRTNNCSQVIVAFRGTETKLADLVLDGIANLRSLFRWAPIEDQYDQAARLIRVLADKYPGCFHQYARVTVVGHSLGAGLAQYAAYSNQSITAVYAFDSSFVTGFSEISQPLYRAQMRKKWDNLTIHRVHEHGEFLQPFRWLTESVFTPQPCSPTVRTVRFNTISSLNPFSSHSIEGLAFGIFKSAHERPVSQEQINAAVRQQRQKNERVVQVNCDKLQF